jgi:transposase InsO family protein
MIRVSEHAHETGTDHDKYIENVAYDTASQATQGIGVWMDFYNQDRRHASLDRMTPDQVYYGLPSGLPMAA